MTGVADEGGDYLTWLAESLNQVVTLAWEPLVERLVARRGSTASLVLILQATASWAALAGP